VSTICSVVKTPLETRPSKLSCNQTCCASVRSRLHKFDQGVSLRCHSFVLKNQGCDRVDNDSLGPNFPNTRLNHLDQCCHRELLSADSQFSHLYLGRKISDRRSF